MRSYTASIPIYRKISSYFDNFITNFPNDSYYSVRYEKKYLIFQSKRMKSEKNEIRIPECFFRNPVSNEFDFENFQKFMTKFNMMSSLVFNNFDTSDKSINLELIQDIENFPNSVYVLRVIFQTQDEKLISIMDSLFNVLG